jgi:hypothetical protein
MTPELERYTRSVDKKLNLSFDVQTNRHLKTAEQFRLVFVLQDYFTSPSVAPWTGCTTNRNTDCRCPPDT